MERGGTSWETSEVAATTESAPMVTPRSTVVRAHSHAPSSMTIGPLSNSKIGDRRSWLPVHKYARCEMHTSEPIMIDSRLLNSVPTPIHELSPTDSFQGHWTVTPCRISTPSPICAPNQRRIAQRSRLGHQTLVKISVETATHSACAANPRPLS